MYYLKKKSSLLLILLLISLFFSRGLQAGGFSKTVDEAVTRGRKWLLEALKRHEFSHENYPMGIRSLYLYALLKSGINPDNPTVMKELENVERMNPSQTYSVSLHLMALDQWARSRGKVELLKPGEDKQDFSFLGNKTARAQQLVNWLVSAKSSTRAHWSYRQSQQGHDYSNSQFAILGLEIGLRNNLDIPGKVWLQIGETFPSTMSRSRSNVRRRVAITFSRFSGLNARTVTSRVLTFSNVPNGWGYTAGSSSTFSMTCAGLSDLCVARWGIIKEDLLNRGIQAKIEKAMEESMSWIACNWNQLESLRPHANRAQMRYYYTVYSLEKAGDLAEVGRFGTHDWYHEEGQFLLQDQHQEGFWGDHNWKGVATSFALLFLVRATARFHPVKDIVIKTGREKGAKPDDELVYIEELDGNISIGGVLCALLTSSNREMLKIAAKAIERFPPGEKGRLVPTLIILAKSGLKETERFARRYLARISGIKLSDPSRYWDWVKQWIEIRNIQSSRKRKDYKRLFEIAKTSPWESLKVKALETIEKLNVTEAFEVVIELLSDKSVQVRGKAYECLKFLGCPDFSFSPGDSVLKRTIAVEKITLWYERTGIKIIGKKNVEAALTDLFSSPSISRKALSILDTNSDEAVEALMSRMESSVIDCRVFDLLKHLTGKDFGLFPEKWIQWWRETKIGE